MASPRKIGNKWYVAFRDLSGRQRTLSIPAKSEAEAEKTATMFSQWLAAGIDPIRIRATFKEVTELWFEEHVIPHCTWKTMRDYQSAFETYHLPRWSRTTMSKITAFEYQEFRDGIAKAGISDKRVNNVMVPCNKMFSWAKENGYIFDNPAENLRPLRVTHEEMLFFTPEQLSEVVAACDAYNGFYRNHILFLGWTGLRLAELQELRFKDVRWEFGRARIHVQRALKDGKNLVGLPKSGKKRWVGVPTHIEDVLREQEVKHKVNEESLVFPSVTGGRLDQSNLRQRVFYPTLVKLGWREPTEKKKRPKKGEGVRVGRGYCPAKKKSQDAERDYRLHDLRHTFAYIFLNRGSAQGESDLFALKETMGHASITTTMKYAHFAADDSIRVANVLDEAWNSMTNGQNPTPDEPHPEQGV